MSRLSSRREFIQSSLIACGLGVSALVMTACGGGSATPTAIASTGKTFTFNITADDNVEYDVHTLQADAGSKITVNFTNKSKDKLYNWVLAKPGKMLNVATAGSLESEANGYLQANDANIVANTKLLKSGEMDTITFDAPPPGDYQFFCTFPGYYTRMNGILTIK